MSHPNLYRLGNKNGPRYDYVRWGMDVTVVGGKVGPDSGGISTFVKRRPSWEAEKTWRLKRSTPLGAGLKTINDHGKRWLIAPAELMTKETYERHLRALNSKAVQDQQNGEFKSEDTEPEGITQIAAQSQHNDRAVRFVYNALAAVVRETLPVSDWDENDYIDIALLAGSLEDGSLPLSALVWDQEGGWSRDKAFTAQAFSAYIAHEEMVVNASNDDDAKSDAANDHAYLRIICRLNDTENPLLALDMSEADV